MKPKDYLIFKDRLQKGTFTIEDIPRIYKSYYQVAINSKKDFLLGHEEFSKLLMNSKDSFIFRTPQEVANFNNYIFKASPLNSLTYRKNKYPRQEKFANKVLERIQGKKISKILEVGAGAVPFASICLADKGYDVTAIDPKIRKDGFPDEVIARLGVTQIGKDYTGNIDLSEFDLIIGQNPCPVTPDIVKNSVEAGKSYFVEFCACEIPEGYPKSDSYNDEMVFSMWREYLENKYDSHTTDVTYAYSEDLELG